MIDERHSLQELADRILRLERSLYGPDVMEAELVQRTKEHEEWRKTHGLAPPG